MTRLVFSLALLGACGAPQVHVVHRAEPGKDFSALHTYAWAEQPAPGDNTLRTEALRDRVRAAVEPELAAVGFSKADAASADVWIYWYAAVEQKTELRQLDYTQSAPMPERTVDVFEQGTLVIDMVDRERSTLLWRARAQARLVPRASAEEREARVRGAVERMFQGYPGRSPAP